MPLSPPAARAPVHTREVVCQGFRRDDGLWDIEGRLTDTKAYAFENSFRGRIEPGEPLHAMALRLTLDEDLRIVDVEAVSDAGPYALCPAITGNFRRLIGLKIGSGWRRAALERVGGVQGCTHLVELLWPMATAAYQTLYPVLARKADPERRPALLDSCHVFARSGEVAREQWPRWHEPATEPAG